MMRVRRIVRQLRDAYRVPMTASTPSSIAAQLDALFRLCRRELIATVMRLVRCRSTAEEMKRQIELMTAHD